MASQLRLLSSFPAFHSHRFGDGVDCGDRRCISREGAWDLVLVEYIDDGGYGGKGGDGGVVMLVNVLGGGNVSKKKRNKKGGVV